TRPKGNRVMSNAPWTNRLRNWLGLPPRKACRTQSPRRAPAVCRVEQLEERCVPSATLLKDINTDTLSAFDFSQNQRRSTVSNGSLFFTSNDGIHGGELWKRDGTVGGTPLVKDINPGSDTAFRIGLPPPQLTDVNGTLFFVAFDPVHGGELW